MNYMKYTTTVENKTIDLNCVIRINDVAVIPKDEGNTDYQEYLAWLEQGNEPLDFDESIFINQFPQ